MDILFILIRINVCIYIQTRLFLGIRGFLFDKTELFCLITFMINNKEAAYT